MRQKRGLAASILIGKKFSRLMPVAVVDRPIMVTYLECKCDCGSIMYVKPCDLRSGAVRSCGCLNKETQRERLIKINFKHGASASAEYKTWSSMKRRCYKPTCKEFQFYGARGIVMCASWLESFENFLRDMGLKPSSKHSIERKDVNGQYEPDNCVWATDHEQMRNRRSTRKFTVNGETLCITDLAKKYDKNYKLVHSRLGRGWDINQALELK